MPRLSSELCSAFTHLCESSGIIGRSASGAGSGAADDTWRAVLACAAKSHAAKTGQQRLRSRFFPQASFTPPKSSAERSSRQVCVWVWTG
jgi:hypothetical protein